jgi:hypothetical protein
MQRIQQPPYSGEYMKRKTDLTMPLPQACQALGLPWHAAYALLLSGRFDGEQVLIYLVNLADKYDLDPLACALEKLETNKAKYPAPEVRGSARKYNEYRHS